MHIKGLVTVAASGGGDTLIAETGMVVSGGHGEACGDGRSDDVGASGDDGQWWSRWTGRGAISVGGAHDHSGGGDCGHDAGW